MYIIFNIDSTAMKRDKSLKKKKHQQVEMEDEEVQLHEHVIQPEDHNSKINAANWPLLLKNYHQMNVLSTHYTPIPAGSTPLKRPIKEYLKYGIINLDKPSNPSSH